MIETRRPINLVEASSLEEIIKNVVRTIITDELKPLLTTPDQRSDNNRPHLVTTKALAEYYSVSEETIRKWRKKNLLGKTTIIERRVYFNSEEAFKLKK